MGGGLSRKHLIRTAICCQRREQTSTHGQSKGHWTPAAQPLLLAGTKGPHSSSTSVQAVEMRERERERERGGGLGGWGVESEPNWAWVSFELLAGELIPRLFCLAAQSRSMKRRRGMRLIPVHHCRERIYSHVLGWTAAVAEDWTNCSIAAVPLWPRSTWCRCQWPRSDRELNRFDLFRIVSK